jgi:hypothetical protein
MIEPRKIKRDVPQHVVSETSEMLTREYLNTKYMLDKTTARFNELKKALSDLVDEQGQADDKGSLWMAAGEHQCKREKRLSISLDEDAAEGWAKEIGIWDDVKVVVEKIDPDKLMAACWGNEEYSEKMESLFKEKVTWAFKVIEGKKSYYEE